MVAKAASKYASDPELNIRCREFLENLVTYWKTEIATELNEISRGIPSSYDAYERAEGLMEELTRAAKLLGRKCSK